MKNTILGMCFVFFIVISMSIIYTIDGRRIKKEETVDSLSSAIESSMQMLVDHKYKIADNEEFIADFTQALLLQVESDFTVTINILDIDYEKGILSIEVVEDYKHPNGSPATVACVKTVILEQDIDNSQTEANRQVKITYWIPGNGTNVIYKEFSIKKGSEIIIPQSPNIEDKIFIQWTLNGSQYILSDSDRNKVKVNEDISLFAEFDWFWIRQKYIKTLKVY